MPSVSSLLPATGTQRASLRPRLLFLASTNSQGGIEHHSVEIAAGLQAQGVSIFYGCPPGSHLEGWCRERGIPTLPFQVRNSGDLAAAVRLARLIRAQEIEIVHAHSRRDYVIAVLGVALARRFSSRRISLVLHAHMIRPLGEPPRLAGKFFEWGADAVVAVSGAVCDRLRHDHEFHPAFVHLIYNGVDLDAFALPGSAESQARRQAARQSWAVPEGALVLGMIGRLDAKGQATLIQAAPTLVARHPSLRLVFIGSEGKVGEQARLTTQAGKLGLAGHLVFTGPREDIPALLPAFDVLAHLPRDESFGLALVEAMAAGLPTVATRIGGCLEVVREGVTGLLAMPNNVPEITQALLYLLDTADGPGRRVVMGRAGHHIVEEEFTRERQIHRLRALYTELCALPGA